MRVDRSRPWGYFIYRTTYASDEDWTSGLAKLKRRFDSMVCRIKYEGAAGKLIADGFRNVIINDKDTLDSASVETVLVRHRNWVESHGLSRYSNLRFRCCLMIDEQCLRSIVASPDPYKEPTEAPMGYINILYMDHDPVAEDYDEGPFYEACMRLIWMRLPLMHLRARISRSVSSRQSLDFPAQNIRVITFPRRVKDEQ
jgi:hypothetical protein